jgi:hypothetical protein
MKLKKCIIFFIVLLFINIPIFADFAEIYESQSNSFISGLDINSLLLGSGEKSNTSLAAQFATVSGSLEKGQIELSLDLNSLLENGIPWFWDGWHKGWLLHIPSLGLDPSIYNNMVLTFELILSDGTITRTSGTVVSTEAGIALLVGLEGLNLSSCLTGTLNLALSLAETSPGFQVQVPEPGVLLLLGLGLISVFVTGFLYKKKTFKGKA